jgi:hypothetical protein
MSAELIGIIAAAIALGTTTLASMRGLRQDMRDLRTELREEIKAGDSAIRDELKGLEGRLRDEMKAGENAIREEMNASDSSIREEMKAGFKELTARMVDIGDRLSKIEGIIEGMFWGSRNQPPDKPREGVA